MYKKNLLKKGLKIGLIAAVMGVAITKCSFYWGLNDIKNLPKYTDAFKGFTKNIIKVIDNTDFNDDKSIDNMVNNVINWTNEVTEKNQELGEFIEAKLERVVDGDTIVVEINQEKYKVRLIGIDTPESVASQDYLDRTGKENTQEGIDASEYTKKLLENVQTVYLEKDVSDTDKYGRLLRYVWIEKPNEINMETISTQMLNGILLKDGIAQIATYQPNVKYVNYFQELNQNIYDELEER